MLIEPSEGGAFVGLKNTVAAWAPARNVAIAVTARAKTRSVALSTRNGRSKDRDRVGWGFMGLCEFALRAGRGVRSRRAVANAQSRGWTTETTRGRYVPSTFAWA